MGLGVIKENRQGLVGLSSIRICGITSITTESYFDWSLCMYVCLYVCMYVCMPYFIFKKLNCGYKNALTIKVNRTNVLEVLKA